MLSMLSQTRGLALLLLLSSSLVCVVEAAHNGKQTHRLASCGTGQLPAAGQFERQVADLCRYTPSA